MNAVVKNVLKSRIRLNLDEYGIIPKSLYTCNPGRNWTKSEFRDPHVKGTLPKFRKFVPAFLSDNVNITKHYRQNLLDLPKNLRSRLLDGNWDYSADPSQLMSTEAITNIFLNTFVKAEGKRCITADIARMGRDRTIVRVWQGWRVIERVELNKLRITESAERIRNIANAHMIPMSDVLCDEDGVGGGVVDILRCKGFVANKAPFKIGLKVANNQNFKTVKDQCGWYLANKVNNNEVYEFCESPELRDTMIEEFEQIKDAGMDKDMKKGLVSKDKIKEAIGRSPDDSDTYLMRSWFDLNTQAGITILA